MWYQSPDGELYNLAQAREIYFDYDVHMIKAVFPNDPLHSCLLNVHGDMDLDDCLKWFASFVGAKGYEWTN